jgi:hypothetical protein
LFPVRVRNADGNRDLTAANFINLSDPPAPPPAITSVTPASGPQAGGTPVILRGSGFSSIWAGSSGDAFCTFPDDWIGVHFGGSASGCGFGFGSETMIDDDTLLVTAPPGTGTVDVTATTNGGTSPASPASQFSFGTPAQLPDQPQITGITPMSADRGAAITISGTDLTPGPGPATVDFNGCLPVPAEPNPDGGVTVTVPACAAPGAQALILTNANGYYFLTGDLGNFTVTGNPSAVTVTGFSPAYGPPGTTVTITGSNIAYLPDVSFGCGFAEPTANRDGTLTAIVPGCAQTGPIQLNGPALSQPVSSDATFTVTR